MSSASTPENPSQRERRRQFRRPDHPNGYYARMNFKAWLMFGAALLLVPQTPPLADAVLINGHVITVDARFSIAEAVAIKDGRFSAVGTTAAIRKLAGPHTRTIDLHGQSGLRGRAVTCMTLASDPAWICRAPDRSPTC